MRRLRALVSLLVLLAPGVAVAHVAPRALAPSSDGGLDLSLERPAEVRFAAASGGSVAIDGPYLVHLRPSSPRMEVTVLSRDGHVTTLDIDVARRTVRAERQTDPPLVVAGRLLMFVALITVAGGAAIAHLVVAPALRAPIGRLGVASDPDDRTLAAAGGGPRRIGRALALVGVVGAALGLAGLAHRLGTSALWELATRTRAGQVLLVVAAASLVAALALTVGRGTIGGSTATAGIAAGAGLVAMSLGGHATSGTDAVLGGAFDVAHVLATAIWLGGLLILLCVRTATRTAWGGAGIGTLAAVVVRFSAVAIACVAVIAVTGTYRALAELSSLGDLTGTAYGRALTVKLALFALMLGVGAYNRLVIHPRLERAALGLADDDRGAERALGVSVRAEIVLATFVLGVVALMIGYPPPG